MNEPKRLPRTILIICGKLCSGKEHYYNTYVHDETYTRIVVSDVVKDLSGKTDRADLQKTADLDIDIIDRLATYIELFPDYVAIDGIRQLSILEGLEYVFPDDTFIYIWLEIPEEIRRKRFTERASLKDTKTTFEQAEAADIKLGIDELYKGLNAESRRQTLRVFNEHYNRIR